MAALALVSHGIGRGALFLRQPVHELDLQVSIDEGELPSSGSVPPLADVPFYLVF